MRLGRRFPATWPVACLLAPIVALAPIAVEAQGAARQVLPAPAVEVVDATGRVIGPVLTVGVLGGPLESQNIPDHSDLVVTVLLRLSGQVVVVGVARDHFVSAPLLSLPQLNTGLPVVVPVFDLAFEGPSCTGNARLFSVVNPGPPQPAPSVPAILRRTAVGPGNVLYVESGPESSVATQSYFDSGRQVCLSVGPSSSSLPAAVLADLDELFTQPFTLR